MEPWDLRDGSLDGTEKGCGAPKAVASVLSAKVSARRVFLSEQEIAYVVSADREKKTSIADGTMISE